MATIVSHTDFTADLLIPGLENTHVQRALQKFIDKYEQKYLLAVMGATVFAQFQAAIFLQNAPTKWLLLKIGGAWNTGDGRQQHFEGLKEAIASYVYYWWKRDGISQSTQEGEVVPKTEAGTRAAGRLKSIRAYNTAVDTAHNLIVLLSMSHTLGVRTYPDFDLSAVDAEILHPINPML